MTSQNCHPGISTDGRYSQLPSPIMLQSHRLVETRSRSDLIHVSTEVNTSAASEVEATLYAKRAAKELLEEAFWSAQNSLDTE